MRWPKRQLIASPQAAEKPTPQDPEDALRLAIAELEEAKTKAEVADEERRKALQAKAEADNQRNTLEREVQKLREMLKAQGTE
jgi:molecular chaperone GrpE (heat shock protein)